MKQWKIKLQQLILQNTKPGSHPLFKLLVKKFRILFQSKAKHFCIWLFSLLFN